MTTIRELLTGLAIVLGILMAVTLIVVGLAVIQRPTETHFRAACAEVKGNAVWNGRHWECIK